MAFIVLDQTRTPDGKVRYVQFGDECETFEEAQRLAQFPNLRDPIIVNLEDVFEPNRPNRLRLEVQGPPMRHGKA